MINVANAWTQDVPGVEGFGSRRPSGLWVAVDLDAVPGLREVFERQRAGHDFDIVTRWGAELPNDPSEPAYAVLDVSLPEVGLAFEMRLDVEEYKMSLLAAVRTGQVLLCEPTLLEALQLKGPEEVFGRHLAMGFEVDDATAVIGLLEQRLGLPLPTSEPQMRTVSPGMAPQQEFEAFIADVRSPELVAVQARPDGGPLIVLVDPIVTSLRARVAPDVSLVGGWAAVVVGPHGVVRFDAFAGGMPLGRWAIADPAPELVRAGSTGQHVVVLMSERPSTAPEVASRQWSESLHFLVEHVEAFRALMR